MSFIKFRKSFIITAGIIVCFFPKIANAENQIVNVNNHLNEYGEELEYNLSGNDQVSANSNLNIYDFPKNIKNIKNGDHQQPDTIFGGESRKIISNTSIYPYSAVVQLVMKYNDGYYIGSGSIINSNYVLTAAHNVYNAKKKEWASSVDVVAGAFPSGNSVGSYFPKTHSVKNIIPDTYNGNFNDDIAILKLANPIGKQTGTFGITKNISKSITLTGFPGDKYTYNNLPRMTTETKNYHSLSNSMIEHKLDTSGGASGSGVYNKNSNNIFGVHVASPTKYDFVPENYPDTNSAVRINNQWFNFIGTYAELTPPGKKVDKIVNIRSKEYNIWQNFVTWKKKSTTSDKLGNAYRVKYEYEHFDGNTYYSLYDKNNNWQGYINKGGTRELVAQSTGNMIVSVRSENYNIWQNFFWVKKNDTKGKLHKAYRVKYKYDHYNGDTYYSLYDNNNNWQGYINKTGVQELKAESLNKMVTISKTTYNIWQNFFWQKKSDTSDKLGYTYKAKYQYKHSNGSTYYSLYNKEDQWIGYLHSGAAPIMDAVTFNKNVKIKSENYNIFNNFFFDKRDHTKGKLGNVYNARYVYTRGNGIKYYSLYDKNNNWIGYLDTRATEVTNNAFRSMPMIEDSSESTEEDVQDPATENSEDSKPTNTNDEHDNLDPHESQSESHDNIDPK